jgi:hypothetical protein
MVSSVNERDTDLVGPSNAAGLRSSQHKRQMAWSLALCSAVLACLAVLALVYSLQTSSNVLASPSETQLDCSSCHSVELQSHSALGHGNDACRACHANPNMQALQLANGTELTLTNSPPLCAECHQARYAAWEAGTHGFPGFKAGMPAGNDGSQTTCTACHNPHQPRVVLANITKPHPAAAPAPPAPPKDALIMLGISLAVVAVALVVTIAQGRQA